MLTTGRHAFHLQPVCRLRVFAVKATGPSGQGLALNLALRHAQAPLIGDDPDIYCLLLYTETGGDGLARIRVPGRLFFHSQRSGDDVFTPEILLLILVGEMEADDLRPPDTFKSLSEALGDPDLDAVASQVGAVIPSRMGSSVTAFVGLAAQAACLCCRLS